jgi:cytochrome c biogenesis protein CcmG/thiol:disulfide interchange protein DsbE
VSEAEEPAQSQSGARANPKPPPQGRGPILAIVGVVGVVVLALLLLFGLNLGGSDGPDTSEEVLADRAPPLAATTTEGEVFDIAAEEGRWVLVNFFATWCPPCVAEHPELVEFAEAHPDDAEVVSVAFDEPAPVIEEFFATNGGDWPVVADSAGIPLDWGVVKLPESFRVAPDGTVVEKLEGGVTTEQLEALMSEHSSGEESGA